MIICVFSQYILVEVSFANLASHANPKTANKPSEIPRGMQKIYIEGASFLNVCFFLSVKLLLKVSGEIWLLISSFT